MIFHATEEELKKKKFSPPRLLREDNKKQETREQHFSGSRYRSGEWPDPERGVSKFASFSCAFDVTGQEMGWPRPGSGRWLLSGRDNTCKYNPAGFHGAFNVSRACGMDIARAYPRVENFQK